MASRCSRGPAGVCISPRRVNGCAPRPRRRCASCELAVLYAGSPLARIERGLLFGMVPTAAGVLAAPLLASLGTAFPNVHFHVAVAETDDLVLRMLSGAVDLAVINPVPDDRLFYRHLLVEDLVLVGGPTSDLTPETPVRFADLARLPLVMPSAQTGIRNTLKTTALRVKLLYRTLFDQLARSLDATWSRATRLRSAAAGGLWPRHRRRTVAVGADLRTRNQPPARRGRDRRAGAASRVRDEDRDPAARRGFAADQIRLLAGEVRAFAGVGSEFAGTADLDGSRLRCSPKEGS